MKTNFKNFGPDTAIYSEGDWPNEAYRIVRGNVEISVSSGGRRVVTGTLGPGNVFGEMSLLQQRRREVTARALCDTDLEVIGSDGFLRELCAEPKTLSRYLDQVFERLRATSERLRSEMLKHGHGSFAATREGAADGSAVAAATGAEEASIPSQYEVHLHSSLQPLFHQVIDQFPFFVGRKNDSPIEKGADEPKNNAYQFELIGNNAIRPSTPHFAIEVIDDACFVRDLDSSTGTLVNGLRIGQSARDDIARLKPGLNHIILGDATSPYQITVAVNPAKQSA